MTKTLTEKNTPVAYCLLRDKKDFDKVMVDNLLMQT